MKLTISISLIVKCQHSFFIVLDKLRPKAKRQIVNVYFFIVGSAEAREKRYIKLMCGQR